MNMEQWEDDDGRVRLSEFVNRFDVPDGGCEVELSQRHALGSTRRPRGVKKECHVGRVIDDAINRIGLQIRVVITQNDVISGVGDSGCDARDFQL